MKILAIQFKYFGDAVLMTPALRALREHFPNCELHILVPAEIAPLLQHLPWLNRVWPMPRKRGSPSLEKTWPVIRALHREQFDRSVDFAGNDRGAILSFLIGAKNRLGWDERGGFFGRKFCYHQRMPPASTNQHESARLAEILSAWNVSPSSLEVEIAADPALNAVAEKILPVPAVICHMASSQPNRQWPVKHWASLYQIAASGGWPLVFTTATGAREQSLADELKKTAPTAPVLPVMPDLAQFLAVLKRATVFISGDTGPLHFAAGLGVPTISLFGPSPPVRWAPQGGRHRFLAADFCSCGAGLSACQSGNYCLATISPERVFDCLKKVLRS
jgi:ADP-heptose:LPS heptosyltransferase